MLDEAAVCEGEYMRGASETLMWEIQATKVIHTSFLTIFFSDQDPRCTLFMSGPISPQNSGLDTQLFEIFIVISREKWL